MINLSFPAKAGTIDGRKVNSLPPAIIPRKELQTEYVDLVRASDLFNRLDVLRGALPHRRDESIPSFPQNRGG